MLVLRDEPWIDDCIPNSYPFVGELADLANGSVEVTEDWNRAVMANKELVGHVQKVRHPEHCGDA